MMASSRKVETLQKVVIPKDRPSSAQWSINDDKAVLMETDYELVKKIGHGSFAKVWKARSFRLKKDVAIKIISKPQASSEYVERFLPRELAIIQKLKHKNLIKFYEVIETWHSVYIVMELAEKGTIADLINRKRFIPENQSRKFFTQLLNVVEYCHLNGIVHRDIKCENLLLDKETNLLLTDFGFAKQDVYPLASGRLRPSKTYCGSYAYAPPEVLSNKPYNPCLADVWCMGMVLYTMLFGILPYKHQNMKALIAAKKNPPNFPDSPYVTPRAKKFLLLMLIPESERAQIATLRMDQWLTVAKSTQMRRFAWLPGLRSQIGEDSDLEYYSAISTSAHQVEEGSEIEVKSTTAEISDNRISAVEDTIGNSSSDSEDKALTSQIS